MRRIQTQTDQTFYPRNNPPGWRLGKRVRYYIGGLLVTLPLDDSVSSPCVDPAGVAVLGNWGVFYV